MEGVSGLVQLTTYISASIALKYGTSGPNISSSSSHNLKVFLLELVIWWQLGQLMYVFYLYISLYYLLGIGSLVEKKIPPFQMLNL